MSKTSNNDLQILKYLRPEDAGAVKRVCDWLDFAAHGVAEHGGLIRGLISGAAFKATSGALTEAVLPVLHAAAEQKD